MRVLRLLPLLVVSRLALGQATPGSLTRTVTGSTGAVVRVQIGFTNLFNNANFDGPALNISAPAAVSRIRATQTRDLAGPRNGLIGARLEF